MTDNARWTRLAKRLNALPEPAMRREVLAEHLRDLPAEEVLDFLRFASSESRRRRTDFEPTMGAIDDFILTHLREGPIYELLAEVYRLAREAGDEPIARLLVQASPERGPLSPNEAKGDRELQRLPLGQRKFLARGHDRLRLERLLADPEPTVVLNLLQNPLLVERDVVRLAARRPVRAEVLRIVAGSRWALRYQVRLALVQNPYTPPELTLKLVGRLKRQDLLHIAADPNLHPLVRSQAAALASKEA